jgi:hypothetical protein
VSQGAGESFLLILNIAVSTEKNSDIVISTDLGKSVSQGAGESFLLISNITVSKEKARTLYKHGLRKVRVPKKTFSLHQIKKGMKRAISKILPQINYYKASSIEYLKELTII